MHSLLLTMLLVASSIYNNSDGFYLRADLYVSSSEFKCAYQSKSEERI